MNTNWKSLITVFNYKTIAITSLSVLTTFMCVKFDITAKFPDLLIGLAIVFPVVFSISSAFARREFALQRYSEFKGHLISIYFAFRYWPLDKNNQELTAKVRIELDSPSALSRKEALTITQKDSSFFDEEFRKMLSRTISYQGFSLIEVYPTQIQRFHNDPAIIFSYKRTGKKGPVIVRIIQAFTQSGTLRIILSCRESEAIIWNPVLNKIQDSIRNN